jgi:beta-lactamase class C
MLMAACATRLGMLAALLGVAVVGPAAAARAETMRDVVGQVIRPLMAANDIPGMAVGVLIDGQYHIYDFGFASLAPRRPVTGDTVFEIGSISKTFTATLAEYAQSRGYLALTGMASTYLPALRGTAFDRVSLAELGTYTPGGMPLQVPDGIENDAELMAYLKAWQPQYAPGTRRTYSNPSIGLLGFIAAASLHADYATLAQGQMFPALGLRHGFVDIPADEMVNYAEGYGDDHAPVRMTQGELWAETYGVRITANDLLRYLAVNMGMVRVDPRWQRAVLATHTGYDQTPEGGMIQDAGGAGGWEQRANAAGA